MRTQSCGLMKMSPFFFKMSCHNFFFVHLFFSVSVTHSSRGRCKEFGILIMLPVCKGLKVGEKDQLSCVVMLMSMSRKQGVLSVKKQNVTTVSLDQDRLIFGTSPNHTEENTSANIMRPMSMLCFDPCCCELTLAQANTLQLTDIQCCGTEAGVCRCLLI